jgi:O-antigen/teichoic acid export membrane protein
MKNLLLQNRLVGHSLIYISGTLAAGLFNFAFQFVMSRHLSVVDYGELQGLTAMFTILTVLTSTLSYIVIKQVAPMALRQDYSASKAFAQWLLPKIALVSLGSAVIIMLLSPLLRHYLHLHSLAPVVIMGVAIALSLFTGGLSGLLAAWEKFGRVNLILAVSAATKLLAGLWLASIWPTTSYVTWSFVIGGIAGLALAWILMSYLHQPARQAKTVKHNLSSLPIAASFIFALGIALISNIDVMVVKNAASGEVAGYYGAFNVMAMIVLLANISVAQALLPHASGLAEQGRKLSPKTVLTAYGLIAGISLSAAAIYAGLGGPIVGLLFGDRYQVIAPILWLAPIISFLLALIILEANIAYAQNRFGVSYVLAAVVVCMVGAIYLNHDSLVAIAQSLIISFALGYVLMRLYWLLIPHRKVVYA